MQRPGKWLSLSNYWADFYQITQAAKVGHSRDVYKKRRCPEGHRLCDRFVSYLITGCHRTAVHEFQVGAYIRVRPCAQGKGEEWWTNGIVIQVGNERAGCLQLCNLVQSLGRVQMVAVEDDGIIVADAAVDGEFDQAGDIADVVVGQRDEVQLRERGKCVGTPDLVFGKIQMGKVLE